VIPLRNRLGIRVVSGVSGVCDLGRFSSGVTRLAVLGSSLLQCVSEIWRLESTLLVIPFEDFPLRQVSIGGCTA